MNKPTITVGMPAFNEEANIGYLIEDLLKQDLGSYQLEKIVVASDGSDDRTAEIVKAFKDPRVEVIDNKDRQGASARQNQVIKKTKSDVLVLINADIVITDKKFLQKLVGPILAGKADLTSCRMLAIPARKLLEKVLETSMNLKDYMFGLYNKGDNLYSCHGTARALSRRFYQDFQFKASVGEDAYTFLYCKFHNLIYQYVPSTFCLIKLPETMSDHRKQSLRNIQNREMFVKEFNAEFIDQQFGQTAVLYGMPLPILIKGLVWSFFKSPVFTIAYIFLAIYMMFEARKGTKASNTWEIATSSKLVRRD